MTSMAANAIGLLGSAIFIAAYAYTNLRHDFDRLWFNAANFVGAILLLISLSVNFNLAAFVLEAAWGVIALAGTIAALRRKARP